MLHEPIPIPADPAAPAMRILDALRYPVLVLDAGDSITFANADARSSFGDGFVGQPMARLCQGYQRPADFEGTPAARTSVSAGGETYEALISPLEDGSACVSLWPTRNSNSVSVINRSDDLTRLALRNSFMSALEIALRECEGAAPIAVICLDLDRFKLVNDTLGHGIGDELLKKVADRLRKLSGKDDLVARLGGDEFVILQRGIRGAADAEQLAVRLVDLIGRTYVLHGHTVNIGASVGVAIATGPMQARDVVRNADLALYEAKRAGRGRFRFFEPGMDTALQERRDLELDLRRALALKQFELHFQPFLDLQTDAVMGFEALLRWNHPVRGRVPPLDFVSVAEENGLIVKIGDWVLAAACKAAAIWPSDLIVAVNVSPLQFKADTLLASVEQALGKSGLPAHRLELEITEGALLADTDNVLATLHALRSLGVKISMDDFGTGYSSLSYLQRFPFDKIKIDRSFIAGGDNDSMAILKAVSNLGSSMGMAITAEGVETAEQLERIREESCTHVQGYLTGRPMSQDGVQPFLASRS